MGCLLPENESGSMAPGNMFYNLTVTFQPFNGGSFRVLHFHQVQGQRLPVIQHRTGLPGDIGHFGKGRAPGVKADMLPAGTDCAKGLARRCPAVEDKDRIDIGILPVCEFRNFLEITGAGATGGTGRRVKADRVVQLLRGGKHGEGLGKVMDDDGATRHA